MTALRRFCSRDADRIDRALKSPYYSRLLCVSGRLAQPVEQRTFNPLVASSNLAPPTNLQGVSFGWPLFFWQLCRNCAIKQIRDDFRVLRQLRGGQMRIPPHHTLGFPSSHLLHYVKRRSVLHRPA